MSAGAQSRARAGGALNPIGDPVSRASRGRGARNAAYREERERLAPFEHIARQVILRRGELGLTQKELADRVGTSHSAISRLESGHHRASIDTLERVGSALGFRLVVGFEDIPDPARPRARVIA